MDTDGWMDMDGWMDRSMDGLMDRWRVGYSVIGWIGIIFPGIVGEWWKEKDGWRVDILQYYLSYASPLVKKILGPDNPTC